MRRAAPSVKAPAGDRRLTVRLAVLRRRLKALIDTGACRSLISRETFRELKRDMPDLQLHPVPKGMVLRSLSKQVIPAIGRVFLNIYDRVVPFFVVESLYHDVLLGDDALRILKANCNYDPDYVVLASRKHAASQAGQRDVSMASVQLDIDNYISKFPEVFAQAVGPLSTVKDVEVGIEMVGNPTPVAQRQIRQPLSRRKLLQDEVQNMLDLDVIEPSMSEWCSSPVIVGKPMHPGDTEKQYRFCVDYKAINSLIKGDAHPLPNIQEILDGLSGAKVFSVIDISKAFWQLPLKKEHRKYTAFSSFQGLYQFKRLPFGLKTAPAIFQRYMNKIFAKHLGKFLYVYLDDLVIFSPDEASHEKHLDEVFKILSENNLKVRPDKCYLRMPEVKLLGYIVNEHGVKSNPEKVEAIVKMARPTTEKQVRRYLGMVNYYSRLIPNYAKIAKPLTSLLSKCEKGRKDPSVPWGEEQEIAFRALQDELVSDRVMAYPRPDLPYTLHVDACDYAVGGVLSQNIDGVERPIQYVSKQLTGSQLAWPVLVKEGYAIVFCLKKLQCYLHGADFTVYSDHAPLKSLWTKVHANSMVQRWSILLSEMNAKIIYKPGKFNTQADCISRLRYEDESHDLGPDPDCEIAKFLDVGAFWEEQREKELEIEDKMLQELAEVREEIAQITQDGELQVPWSHDSLERDLVIEQQQLMPEYELGRSTEKDYVLMEGLLYTIKPPPGRSTYPRLVLPPSERERVIRRAHTELAHQGMKKTLDRLQEVYSWPKMRNDVYEVLDKCARCQVQNSGRKVRIDPSEMPIAQYPGQLISMDLIGPLTESAHGNKYVLSIIDHCSLWVESYPIPTKEPKHVLRCLEQYYLPRFGPAEACIMDNGSEFQESTVVAYLEYLGTEVKRTSPFNPQCNGRTERFQKTLKMMVRKLVNARARDWEDKLGPALWAYRISCSNTTNYSPFMLTYGRPPIAPKQKLYARQQGAGPELIAERLDELSLAFKDAAQNAEAARVYNLARLRREANASELVVGDHVCILVKDKGNTLDPEFDHGYVVTRVRGPVITAVGPRGQRRIVNRRLVKKVDPSADWKDLNPRISAYLQRKEKKKLAEDQVGKSALPAAARTVGTSSSGGKSPLPPAKRKRIDSASDGEGDDASYQPPTGAREVVDPSFQRVTRSQTRRGLKRDLSETEASDSEDQKAPEKRHRPSDDEIEDMMMDCIAEVSVFFAF